MIRSACEYYEFNFSLVQNDELEDLETPIASAVFPDPHQRTESRSEGMNCH